MCHHFSYNHSSQHPAVEHLLAMLCLREDGGICMGQCLVSISELEHPPSSFQQLK